MAKKSHRISYELLDDDLKSIINSNINVRPLPLSDIQNNINPNNYEYVRPVEREYNNYLYRWDEDHFEMLGGESTYVAWDNVMNKPSEYPPAEHTHTDLHAHSNKSILDIITQTLIDTWNTVTGKADKVHSHDDLYYTEDEVDSKLASKSDADHNHDGVYQIAGDYSVVGHKHTEVDITGLDKYSKTEVDNLLANKAALSHDHDGRYYTKSEADSKIGQKAALVHTHSKADITDFNHTHSKADITDMPSIPTDTSHLSKSDVYTKDEIDNMMVEVGAGDMLKSQYDDDDDGKVNSADSADTLAGLTATITELNYVAGVTSNIQTQLNGKAAISHTHTKSQITDMPTKLSQFINDAGFITKSLTIGTVKPSDGTLWFKEI